MDWIERQNTKETLERAQALVERARAEGQDTASLFSWEPHDAEAILREVCVDDVTAEYADVGRSMFMRIYTFKWPKRRA